MSEIADIHKPFSAWLRKLEVPHVYHRPDTRSGIKTGWPDYTILWMGHVLCIECKWGKGKLSLDQEACVAFIRKSGNKVAVCYSLEQCIEAVKNILCEGNPETLLERRTEPTTEPYAPLPWEDLKQAVRDADEKPSTKAPRPKKQPDLPVNGSNGAVPGGRDLYLLNWKGQPWVVQRKALPPDNLLHPADQHDLQTLSYNPGWSNTPPA